MKRQRPQIGAHLKKGSSIMDMLINSDIERTAVSNFLFEGETVQNLNVTGLEVSGCVFMNCRMLNCIFEGVNFSNCLFKNCDISFMNMTQGGFTNCEIVESKMTGICLRFGVLNNLLVRTSACRRMNLSETKIFVTRFVGCDMTSTELDRSRFNDVEFVQSNLSEVNFTKTPLTGTDLRSNRIDKIVFSGEELEGAIIDPKQAIVLVRLLGLQVKEPNP